MNPASVSPGAVRHPEACPRILAVDDDRGIRSLLAEYLERHGFHIVLAADGAAMWRALEESRPDLMLLDLNLPGEDGLSLCRTLREKSPLPVIILSARNLPGDRIAGLEIGADDYITKPFEPRELLARIRGVLSRFQSLPPGRAPVQAARMAFSNWSLDLRAGHLVDANGVIISLSRTEFRLLKALLDKPGRVITRPQLQALTWDSETAPSERSLDLVVSRLRKKLGDTARAGGLIQTVHHEGYVLAASVSLAH